MENLWTPILQQGQKHNQLQITTGISLDLRLQERRVSSEPPKPNSRRADTTTKRRSIPQTTMKLLSATVLLASIGNGAAFSTTSKSQPVPTTNIDADGKTIDPLLIRAARGETTERVPVWMMRQAGRHIKEYRDLCKKYPTFRERSEIPDVAVEVSLQPWRNYKTDGCILFSDILTPLPGMGVEFDIDEKVGPVVKPMRTYDDVKKVSI